MAVDRGFVFERRLYYGTRFIAQVAQNLFLAALVVATGTSSSAAVGLSSLLVATLVPAILFGFVGGAIADRLGPHRGLVLGAILRFLPVAAAVFWLGGSAGAWVIAFLYSLGSQVFSPAEMALVHALRREAPGQAHSLLVGLQYGGQGVGILGLAPVLYWAGGPHAILVGGAAGLALAAALAALLALRLDGHGLEDAAPAPDGFTFRQTFRFFATEWPARYAVIVLAVKAIVLRSLVVAIPVYLATDVGLGREAMAFVVAPGVLGFVAALVWAGREASLADAVRTMRLALAGTAVAVFALAALDACIGVAADLTHVPPIVQLEASMNTTLAVALPVALLLGLCIGGALVSSRVALTETAPVGQQSRVFAFQITVTDSLVVLPLVLMGVGTEFAGARVTLAAIGVLTVAAMAVAELPQLLSRGNRFVVGEPRLAPARVSLPQFVED